MWLVKCQSWVAHLRRVYLVPGMAICIPFFSNLAYSPPSTCQHRDTGKRSVDEGRKNSPGSGNKTCSYFQFPCTPVRDKEWTAVDRQRSGRIFVVYTLLYSVPGHGAAPATHRKHLSSELQHGTRARPAKRPKCHAGAPEEL
ncbi:hypothetical protein BX600DRAFT_188976 [Xylariales sp. PMI_506]|nr:hypothetical protein BX600DRAFT_188976 [Xylariales sp. PMI_506]